MTLKDAVLAFVNRLPRSLSRRTLFFLYHRRFPRVRHPVTFNEKVNWRILKDRREILACTCDKLAMKDYARSVQSAMAGGLRIPRTLWSGTNVAELKDVELPEHWILKPNNRSGVVYFGHGRPDIAALMETTRSWSRSVQADDMHEWAYSKARSVLLVEELIGVPGSAPSDYKFWVFAGKVAVVEVHDDRHDDHRQRWYLPDWSPLEVTSVGYPLSPANPVPPANLQQMTMIAGELGRSFDYMRVDLYNVDGDIFFGELTPYPASGLDRFDPHSFDIELGAKWELPVL